MVRRECGELPKPAAPLFGSGGGSSDWLMAQGRAASLSSYCLAQKSIPGSRGSARPQQSCLVYYMQFKRTTRYMVQLDQLPDSHGQGSTTTAHRPAIRAL
jgi:hypothetical protein